MQPVMLAIRAKGLGNFLDRGMAIVKSYGLTSERMLGALDCFTRVLVRYGCSATWPITAGIIQNDGRRLHKYVDAGIEFAIHGYQHVDHSRLSYDQLAQHLDLARRAFAKAEIPVSGFRSPYLQFNDQLALAAEASGLRYLSNVAIDWPWLNGRRLAAAASEAYDRAIAFYQPLPAAEALALPRKIGKLVEIPVSLPDDELLLDRLGDATGELTEQAWQAILSRTHAKAGLFTLLLHPERIEACSTALSQVLTSAQSLDPPVWIARMDQVADWWHAKCRTKIAATAVSDGQIQITVEGPEHLTLLARNVKAEGSRLGRIGSYDAYDGKTLRLSCDHRPFIGLPEETSEERLSSLLELGYIVERSSKPSSYSVFLDDRMLTANEQDLQSKIESSSVPLVKINQWPRTYQSAMCVTGDIDALSIWDYGHRFLGR